jgi:hypothetical protein
MSSESNDLHGMVPDTHDMALVLIDVINHLDFEGNEGLNNSKKNEFSQTKNQLFRIIKSR